MSEPTDQERAAYIRVLCDTLNDWAAGGQFHVEGRSLASSWSGVGAVELQKANGSAAKTATKNDDGELLVVLDRLQKAYRKQLGSVELLRGVKVFDQNTVYLFKPLRLRFWTRTAALNDADSIAASILSAPDGRRA